MGRPPHDCLSSVDGDAPGPYPGEDRSSRSRGSDTRVAKRQRRRLLSAPPQVRILPLVHSKRMSPSASPARPPPPQGGDQGSNPCGDASARVHWKDRSSSKRSRVGSNPAGRTCPRGPTGRTPRYERGGWRFESSRGYERRAWFNSDCSRKHLVRLPGCLPGEAGSIPVGGAKTWPMFVSLVRAAAL